MSFSNDIGEFMFSNFSLDNFNLSTLTSIGRQKAATNKSSNKPNRSGVSAIEQYSDEKFQKAALDRLKSELKVEIQKEGIISSNQNFEKLAIIFEYHRSSVNAPQNEIYFIPEEAQGKSKITNHPLNINSKGHTEPPSTSDTNGNIYNFNSNSALNNNLNSVVINNIDFHNTNNIANNNINNNNNSVNVNNNTNNNINIDKNNNSNNINNINSNVNDNGSLNNNDNDNKKNKKIKQNGSKSNSNTSNNSSNNNNNNLNNDCSNNDNNDNDVFRRYNQENLSPEDIFHSDQIHSSQASTS